jgi:hypothetical protein
MKKVLSLTLLLILTSCSPNIENSQLEFVIEDTNRDLIIEFSVFEIEELLATNMYLGFGVTFKDVLKTNVEFKNYTNERLILEGYMIKLLDENNEIIADSNSRFGGPPDGIEFDMTQQSVGSNQSLRSRAVMDLSVNKTFSEFGIYTIVLYYEFFELPIGLQNEEIGSFQIEIKEDRKVYRIS